MAFDLIAAGASRAQVTCASTRQKYFTIMRKQACEIRKVSGVQ
jgi:hypothetical protein